MNNIDSLVKFLPILRLCDFKNVFITNRHNLTANGPDLAKSIKPNTLAAFTAQKINSVTLYIVSRILNEYAIDNNKN